MLVAVLIVFGLFEGVLADDVPWRVVTTVTCVAGVPLLLWRRTHPLLSTVAAFLSGGALLVATDWFAGTPSLLGASALGAAILLYALTRWGSGNEIALGMAVVLLVHVVTDAVDESTGLLEMVVGSFFWLFAAAVGLVVRYRAQNRVRAIEEVRLLEREQLARELHDTVAHHVSVIAIQAQAGRAVAASNPDFAAEALATIEEQATQTLAEMRKMVTALRASEAELEPQRGVADIARLAAEVPGTLPVTVDLDGDLDGLSPSVEAGLFRLAQESVTNARRHARHATRLAVQIVGHPDFVTLSVADDGDPVVRDSARATGFGLVGMTERVALLGGTLEAGPGVDRGWLVRVELPRESVTS